MGMLSARLLVLCLVFVYVNGQRELHDIKWSLKLCNVQVCAEGVHKTSVYASS